MRARARITANNETGVIINYGDNNFLLNNTIFNNPVGFSLQSSNNNTLSDNQMTNNTFNFGISGSSLSHFLHDIDSSNTVNGKPMYYWVNEDNREIPNDAGYVAVVNSRGITVQDLKLTHNAQGVLLAYTTNSTVKNVTAESNGIGIVLQSSYDNTLIGNVASNNMQYGIALSDSGGNILRNNTMTDNAIVNFGVIPGPMSSPSIFINDVDPSNKVDGKPVYYWVNQSSRHVPSDAGCVLIVNSTDITVSNLTLTNNFFGVGLIYSTDSLVRNVTLRNNMMGIALGWCINTLVEESNITDNAQCGFVVMASINSNLTHNWVSGHRFVSGPEGGPLGGFSVLFSNTTTIANNTIGDNSYGIALANSHHNKVLWNSIENNENGISLQYSDGNELTWNRVANNTEGIQLQESNANVVTHNNITSNMNSGLDLANSGGNTLRNNSLADNKWNFGIWGNTLSDFINDVDTSNTVNDNPIVYLINQTNLVISPATFSQVGCLVLVNSTKITVRSLTLANNYESLTFAYTRDSAIANITATNNVVSLLLWASNNNTITANTMRNNWFGPLLGRSNDNKLANNNITNNSQGIGLFNESHNNTLIGNFVKNNSYGIYLHASEQNAFYHNNFINNTNQADIRESSNNTWDNGLEGNYWSNYTGADLDKDGIWDSPYFLHANNTDHYPLRGMFSSFYATSEHHVQTICNSTISDFQFNGTAISFNVSGEDITSGFCRICIPTALMNDAFTIYVDGANTPYSLLPCSNITHSYLYFNYLLSTKEVVIIPEFPSFIIMPLFMIATLLAAVLLKKRKHLSANCARKNERLIEIHQM